MLLNMALHLMEVSLLDWIDWCLFLEVKKPFEIFIAFPKNNSGRDVMIDSPATIDDEQLKELNIKLDIQE